jgi:uncharacterized protein YkwD
MKKVALLLFSLICLDWTVNANAQTSRQEITSTIEQRIAALINLQRQENGVNALALDPALSKIARHHSQDMVNRGFFDHVNPDGKAPRDRLRLAGYTCPKMSGENIYQNNLYSRVTIRGNQKFQDRNSLEQIAASTVSGWMASPGHRQNILQKNYSRTGLGAAIAHNGQVFITQVFCG